MARTINNFWGAETNYLVTEVTASSSGSAGISSVTKKTGVRSFSFSTNGWLQFSPFTSTTNQNGYHSVGFWLYADDQGAGECPAFSAVAYDGTATRVFAISAVSSLTTSSYFRVTDASLGVLCTSSAGSYTPNTWHHVEVVLSTGTGSAEVFLYIDGVLDGSTTTGTLDLTGISFVEFTLSTDGCFCVS